MTTTPTLENLLERATHILQKLADSSRDFQEDAAETQKAARHLNQAQQNISKSPILLQWKTVLEQIARTTGDYSANLSKWEERSGGYEREIHSILSSIQMFDTALQAVRAHNAEDSLMAELSKATPGENGSIKIIVDHKASNPLFGTDQWGSGWAVADINMDITYTLNLLLMMNHLSPEDADLNQIQSGPHGRNEVTLSAKRAEILSNLLVSDASESAATRQNLMAPLEQILEAS